VCETPAHTVSRFTSEWQLLTYCMAGLYSSAKGRDSWIAVDSAVTVEQGWSFWIKGTWKWIYLVNLGCATWQKKKKSSQHKQVQVAPTTANVQTIESQTGATGIIPKHVVSLICNCPSLKGEYGAPWKTPHVLPYKMLLGTSLLAYLTRGSASKGSIYYNVNSFVTMLFLHWCTMCTYSTGTNQSALLGQTSI